MTKPWYVVIEELFHEHTCLTKAELTKALGRTPGTITRWMKKGQVPFDGPHDDPRFDLFSVLQALAVINIPRQRRRRS